MKQTQVSYRRPHGSLDLETCHTRPHGGMRAAARGQARERERERERGRREEERRTGGGFAYALAGLSVCPKPYTHKRARKNVEVMINR